MVVGALIFRPIHDLRPTLSKLRVPLHIAFLPCHHRALYISQMRSILVEINCKVQSAKLHITI
jgi:hypothetical protein